MSKIALSIWGREFNLDVIYETFTGKDVIENQRVVLKKIADIDFSESKTALEQYILEENSEDLGSDKVDNLFKYVIPKSLFIVREEEVRIFAIMCKYKFDLEHGLAVVFENEKLKAIGPQDIIL